MSASFNQDALRWSAFYLLSALAIIVVAFFAPYGVQKLDLSKFGNCEDVPQALLRDQFVARDRIQYEWQVFALHGLAFFILAWLWRFKRTRIYNTLLGVFWVGSFALHLFVFVIMAATAA